jgi:hypothetical protein
MNRQSSLLSPETVGRWPSLGWPRSRRSRSTTFRQKKKKKKMTKKDQ